MKKIKLLTIFLFTFYPISCAYAHICQDNKILNKEINNICNVEFAQVKQVTDGDTINIYTGGYIFPIRLYGIDCMETAKIQRAYKQAYDNKTNIDDILKQGKNAKYILKNIIKESNNFIYFKSMGIDKYGRLLAIIYDRNLENINTKMANTEYCSAYIKIKN